MNLSENKAVCNHNSTQLLTVQCIILFGRSNQTELFRDYMECNSVHGLAEAVMLPQWTVIHYQNVQMCLYNYTTDHDYINHA